MLKKPLFYAVTLIVTILTFTVLDQYTHFSSLTYKNIKEIGSLQETASVASSAQKLAEKKPLKILLVPGHEPDFGGTEYKNLKERNLNVEIAQKIAEKLKTDPRFDVMIARDKDNWNPILAQYFASSFDDIKKFTNEKKKASADAIKNGSLVVADGMEHNAAPDEVALRLYGINKWVGENNIDAVLHIHLNEYPRKKRTQPGVYRGFAIYTPESQYKNATSSLLFSTLMFNRLVEKFPVSNLASENDGIIEDQELIAVGAHNTLAIPSILIEYGYLYESGLTNTALQAKTIDDYAEATFQGFKDYADKLLSVVY